MVLQHIKKGSLLPQDVQTLQALYPGLHSAIANKISQEIINHKTAGGNIPYSQRVSMSLLLGNSLDSTMTPQSGQAIIHSAGPQQMQQSKPEKSGGKATGAQLKAIDKVTNLYQTPSEARQASKTK